MSGPSYDKAQANARLIVAAVNSHAALLEALVTRHDTGLFTGSLRTRRSDDSFYAALDAARAALALANGGGR